MNLVNSSHIQIFLGSLFAYIAIFIACSEQTSQSLLTPESLINPPTIEKINGRQIAIPEIVPSPPPTLTPLASKEPITPVSPNNPKVDTISELIAQVADEPDISSSGKKGGSLKLASKDYFESLDPHQNYSAAYSTWGIGVMYQRLLKFSSGPNIVLPSKKSNMVPVAVPIKVRSISKTTVLPAIEKQKTSQPTRPGSTVPVFNINSDSTARSVTLISLGIEETL